MSPAHPAPAAVTIATDDGGFTPSTAHRDPGRLQIAVPMRRTLSVDEEPLARAHPRSLLEGGSGVVVASECDDGARAAGVSAGRSAPPAEPPGFVIRSSGRVTLVPPADIDWVEAMDNYVRVHIGPATHTIRDTLTGVIRRLPAHMFLRVHRSAAINIGRFRELRTLAGTQHVVILADGTRVAAGRRHRLAIRRLLNQSQ